MLFSDLEIGGRYRYGGQPVTVTGRHPRDRASGRPENSVDVRFDCGRVREKVWPGEICTDEQWQQTLSRRAEDRRRFEQWTQALRCRPTLPGVQFDARTNGVLISVTREGLRQLQSLHREGLRSLSAEFRINSERLRRTLGGGAGSHVALWRDGELIDGRPVVAAVKAPEHMLLALLEVLPACDQPAGSALAELLG